MWVNIFGDEKLDFKHVYCKKVVEIKDVKLAETNYKVLQNILPCGENLFKWKKRDSALCPICNVKENVMHLIYECNYANKIWTFVKNVLNEDLKLKDIWV